jgi:hypothetical protein
MPTVTPGLPNTGFGGVAVNASLVSILVVIAAIPLAIIVVVKKRSAL